MMKRILFATDLDNTLLFSHRHRQPGDRCAELWNGAEQGFFTPETVDLLRNHPLMPADVTIRGYVINTETGELTPQE